MDRLTDVVRPWIETAMTKHSLGAPGRWETAFAVAPSPQGPVPMLVLYMEIPSYANIGQVTGQVSQMPAAGVTEEAMATVIGKSLDELYKRRNAELATTNGHGEQGKLQLPR